MGDIREYGNNKKAGHHVQTSSGRVKQGPLPYNKKETGFSYCGYIKGKMKKDQAWEKEDEGSSVGIVTFYVLVSRRCHRRQRRHRTMCFLFRCSGRSGRVLIIVKTGERRRSKRTHSSCIHRAFACSREIDIRQSQT